MDSESQRKEEEQLQEGAEVDEIPSEPMMPVQRRTKRKKGAALLGAKSLNRLMHAVWPAAIVLTRRRNKGNKAAATTLAAAAAAAHPTGICLETAEHGLPGAAAAAVGSSGATVTDDDPATGSGLADDASSLAESLKLCDLLEAAVSKSAIVVVSRDRKLSVGDDLHQENPACEARVSCALCEDDERCALLDSLAGAACVRVDVGKLILGQGDVLELDKDVDGVLDPLRKRHPDCRLQISCERCHSPTGNGGVILKTEEVETRETSCCNDCTATECEGEVFHEEGCCAPRRQTRFQE